MVPDGNAEEPCLVGRVPAFAIPSPQGIDRLVQHLLDRLPEARRLFGRDPKLPLATEKDYVTPWSAGRAEKQFLARFRALCG